MFNFLSKLIPDWLKIIIFKVGGKKPWSKGYAAFKFHYIMGVLNDREMLRKFKNSEILNKNYGCGLDERVVEYPWVLSRISVSAMGNILDAGSALNFREILKQKILENKKISIINLNPEPTCFWEKRVSYFFGDIRELPFKDNNFDSITCISTLEHIGMDNSMYTRKKSDKEQKIFDFEKAVLELKRVLKDNGTLFITVPFGKYRNFGWFQQFDANLIKKILKIFNPRKHKIDYYKYEKEGWNIADEGSCKYTDYSNGQGSSTAAAGAIACLELIK